MDVKLILFLAFVCVNGEYVNRKICHNADQNKCNIHSVKLDPCPDGPGFCLIRRNELYSLAFDFTPRFQARKLKVSMVSDIDDTGAFDIPIMPIMDACEHHTCPLEDIRQIFEMDFTYKFQTHGKFPIKVMLWNEDDVEESCCFTFNVKMLK